MSFLIPAWFTQGLETALRPIINLITAQQANLNRILLYWQLYTEAKDPFTWDGSTIERRFWQQLSGLDTFMFPERWDGTVKCKGSHSDDMATQVIIKLAKDIKALLEGGDTGTEPTRHIDPKDSLIHNVDKLITAVKAINFDDLSKELTLTTGIKDIRADIAALKNDNSPIMIKLAALEKKIDAIKPGCSCADIEAKMKVIIDNAFRNHPYPQPTPYPNPSPSPGPGPTDYSNILPPFHAPFEIRDDVITTGQIMPITQAYPYDNYYGGNWSDNPNRKWYQGPYHMQPSTQFSYTMAPSPGPITTGQITPVTNPVTSQLGPVTTAFPITTSPIVPIMEPPIFVFSDVISTMAGVSTSVQ